MSQIKEVSIVLDTYPHTRAIKDGSLADPGIKLNFTEYKPIRKAFDDMLRDQPFDICEMALGTFLQALDAGKPIKLLPVVMGGEFHHGSLWYNPALGKMSPSDLKGKRVGVRAYTQTTGVWVRGVLSEQFGVPSKDVTWVTTEAQHLSDYQCPPNVEFVEGAKLDDMVRSGELAAVIMGTKQGAPEGLERLVPDVDGAITQWFDAHHAVPINHMVVLKEDVDMDAVHAVYDLIVKGLRQAYPVEERNERFALQDGVKNVWNAVEMAMKYSYEQGLISRIFEINEIFDQSFL